MPEFDPSYGYTLNQLLTVPAPTEPEGFAEFWRSRYRSALQVVPAPKLQSADESHPVYVCYDLTFQSIDGFPIGGWFLRPKNRAIKRGIVVGHGYGGRDAPDFHLPIDDAAFLFPCFRGLSRSRRWPISDNPSYHVLHDIDKRDDYILGKCVADLWVAVSALLALAPETIEHVGYLGISFGGGIGALALPWDQRIRRAHFNVPSFGNHPLRMQLPTWGSAGAIQDYYQAHRHVLETLVYYDAAIAARYIGVPVHVAAALADPVVAPPGQFSIYNAIPGEKQLFVLEQGHADYPSKTLQDQALLKALQDFFSNV